MTASAVSILSVDSCGSRSELIGHDRGLRQIWSAVEMVAPTDAAVLILGETGTGKELIARAVYGGNHRRRGAFVKINCAAMPAGLLESELFGHERGAYTGALHQTTGRFQLADGGTLFLDEIGELPLELQPKLLRVLEEQEFERLGSGRTIRVDVRIVAATNQNLPQRMCEGKFRADLFYRLNVFPISMPPLRRRVEDIPLLVNYFMERASRRMRKEVHFLTDETMQAFLEYSWPGNVRELQNVIERAVILSSDGELRIPWDCLEALPLAVPPERQRTLAEAEGEHIRSALRATRGVVGGKSGAAARLGIPRTTLLAKMQKLRIANGGVEDHTRAFV
jgi:formate hydrogenlyase transcriptional activator